jgi:predicted exporter
MDFTAAWHWPQWTLLVLLVLALLGHAVKHGQPRDNHNAFLAFIDFGLTMFILIAGGFFA